MVILKLLPSDGDVVIDVESDFEDLRLVPSLSRAIIGPIRSNAAASGEDNSGNPKEFVKRENSGVVSGDETAQGSPAKKSDSGRVNKSDHKRVRQGEISDTTEKRKKKKKKKTVTLSSSSLVAEGAAGRVETVMRSGMIGDQAKAMVAVNVAEMFVEKDCVKASKQQRSVAIVDADTNEGLVGGEDDESSGHGKVDNVESKNGNSPVNADDPKKFNGDDFWAQYVFLKDAVESVLSNGPCENFPKGLFKENVRGLGADKAKEWDETWMALRLEELEHETRKRGFIVELSKFVLDALKNKL